MAWGRIDNWRNLLACGVLGLVELSERLAAVAGYVPEGAVVADIGTDHAYLPVYLVQAGIVPRALAVDVRPGPCAAARATVAAYGMEQSIEVRMGDGLQALAPGEARVLVLAGMGGQTIIQILSEGKGVLEQASRLILQPMRDACPVRRWLAGNGWRLADEDLVREGKHYYAIMAAEKGVEVIEDWFALRVGPRLLEKRGAVWLEYLRQRLAEINNILPGLYRTNSAGALERVAELRREEARIKEVLADGRKS